jgi:hypothetical protein
MNIGRRSACAAVALGYLFLLGMAGLGWMNPALAAQGNGNPKGAGGQMPAYYDGELFTVNMFEVPGGDAILEHNKSVNEIYASNDLDEEQEFIPVIDAIQGDGFNPLWHQNLYSFNTGFPAHQFTSDEEVLAAAAAGEITLVSTDEVYRCSVVGPGPKKVEE